MNKNFLKKLIILLLVLMGLASLSVTIAFFIQSSLSLNTRLIISSFLTLDALFYFLGAWGINRQNKLAYYLLLIFLSLNILATFSDEVGFYDILFLVLNVVMLILLILHKKRTSH